VEGVGDVLAVLLCCVGIALHEIECGCPTGVAVLLPDSGDSLLLFTHYTDQDKSIFVDVAQELDLSGMAD